MKRTLTILLLCSSLAASAATFTSSAPSTTNNDDSCDIGVFPAATLLLPYFEVDFNSPQSVARTTLFTIVNHSHSAQIARVTLWSDYAYPVLNFNIFLTGYDVQAINLYDILGPRASVPATSSLTGEGSRSMPNSENANFLSGAISACAQLPGAIPANILADLRSSLTTGQTSTCATVGLKHPNAIGYVTVDLVATCGPKLQTDAGYFDELLYDNVLSGDYEWIDPNAATGNYAGGSPMVHIRAIPEGGKAGVVASTPLPYTFYDLYTPGVSDDTRAMDRRQPLPNVFASRFIEGGPGAFNTQLRIWREGVVGAAAVCGDYANNISSQMKVTSLVRFDEHENPTVPANPVGPSPIIPQTIIIPPASSPSISAGIFPPLSTSGDVAGWIYLNLSNGGSTAYHAKTGRGLGSTSEVRPNQNWVVTSMTAEGRYQAAFDATMMANGCTAAPSASTPVGPGH